jgi:hypothetical protein
MLDSFGVLVICTFRNRAEAESAVGTSRSSAAWQIEKEEIPPASINGSRVSLRHACLDIIFP